MSNKNLVLEFTLTDTGVNIDIRGSKSVNWVQVLKDAMPRIYDNLAESGCDLEATKAQLIESMAGLADKSVDEVRADLAKMPGDENLNLATLSAQYMSDYIARKFAPESKGAEDVKSKKKDK